MAPTRSPHPWNTGFAWDPLDRAPTTLCVGQAEQFRTDGYTVVRGVFSSDELAELVEACDEGVALVADLLAQLGGRLGVAGLDSQVIAPHLVVRSDVARRACTHPVLVGACRDLMGDDVRLYWEQAVHKVPHGAEPVLWHQDNGYTFVEPQDYLTCWISLTEATSDNGCVWVVPGAQQDGTLVHDDTPIGFECWGDFDAAVEVPTAPGDVVVFSSLSPHATRINTTDDVRKAYIVQYCHADAAARFPGPAGEPGEPVPQDDPNRQFVVLSDGLPVPIPPLR